MQGWVKLACTFSAAALLPAAMAGCTATHEGTGSVRATMSPTMGCPPTSSPAVPASATNRPAPSPVPFQVAWPAKYDRLGEYTNYVDRKSVARNSRAKLDNAGVVTLRTGVCTYYYNPTTISQYGLQSWSYFKRWGRPEDLEVATRQADWLVRTQDKQTGAWNYRINWNVANMDETLKAPWTGAMVQGQAMSLLTRVASAYPDRPEYLRAARLATRPLTKPVSEGGLVNYLDGRPFYEEYPTRTPSFTLNGLQHTLIGLWDLSQAGDREAGRLFDAGFETMVYALPRYDAKTTTAYNLSHVTKPGRELHSADRYHRIHVQLLAVLYAMRPDATVKHYFDLWSTYAPMRSGGLRPVTAPPPPS
ncbi:hypothetical protein GCM10027569_12350 [Flindersiella endophytica]